MSECSKLQSCPFFVKFSNLEEFRLKGFKNMYCAGPLMEQCARIKHKEVEGIKPPDELAPTGILFTVQA